MAVETSSEFCEDGLADPDDNTSFGWRCSVGLSTPSSTSSGKVMNWNIILFFDCINLLFILDEN